MSEISPVVGKCSVTGVGGSGRFGLIGRHQCRHNAVVERVVTENKYERVDGKMTVTGVVNKPTLYCALHDPIRRQQREEKRREEENSVYKRQQEQAEKRNRVVALKESIVARAIALKDMLPDSLVELITKLEQAQNT